MATELVLWLDEVRLEDLARVGGKNASLGELIGVLRSEGVNVPDGFATTSTAFRAFIDHNQLRPQIDAAMGLLASGEKNLAETGSAIREAFVAGEYPRTLESAIRTAYESFAERLGDPAPPVAVRSSATAEDLPDASFAGQQETFLNVRGADRLLDSCRRCFASLYTDRAISYRQAKNIDQLGIAVSVGIQQMVRSDLAGSGVLFSIDTETGFPRSAVISAAWGLGETVVQGSVDPDKYMVFKPLLDEQDKAPIIEKTLGGKEEKLIYAANGAAADTLLVQTSEIERESFVLNDNEVLTLARWACLVERHYGRPMDMEWAKDGLSGELFLVQARPETVQSSWPANMLRTYHLKQRGLPLLSGAAVGEAIAAGEACVIADAADIGRFRDGAILVTGATDPDWVPVLKRAAGIITDHGGPTSHAAIVSRELGIPAIVGTGSATSAISDGQAVTLSCAEGERGVVYQGRLDFTIEEVDVSALPAPHTAIMLNSGDPAKALRWWRLPAKGVGLARMEFIISSMIKIHPMALAHPDLVKDDAASARIAEMAKGYCDPRSFFVETLAAGIAKLASPFHPLPTIVRLSDFKTNEYAHLLGGGSFEPAEENPMLGFRGASRYYDVRYRDGFALECEAIKRARERLGFTNIIVMVPFCRTVGEADRVLDVMATNGLRRGEAGLQIYMMCEIPSNVILAEQFAKRFDGFSIGSNDLTQLILGVDRDSTELGRLFDERDPAVEAMIAQAIAAAHKAGIKIGICGEGPSNHPEFASFLVEEGIDSLSLNPDSFVKTMRRIAEVEASRVRDVAV